MAAPNYPDILGYITDGHKLTFNTVEAAMAIRPEVARAGRPLEVIVMLQNTADVNTTVTATLHLPKFDADKKPRQFFARNESLQTLLRPAEVGYMVIPVATLPDTAPGEDYKIGVNLDVKLHGKPRRVRHNADANLDYYFMLEEKTVRHVLELQSLLFYDTKRGLLAAGMEAPLRLLPAGKAQLADLKPVWSSLWSLADSTDVRPLLERYRDVLRRVVLPQFHSEMFVKPLFAATRQLFEKRGCPINTVEAHYIVKLLITVLMMAKDSNGDHPYHVATLLETGWPEDGQPILLPNWCRAFLFDIGHDDGIIDHPINAIVGRHYLELLKDAMIFAFGMIQHQMEVQLGTDYDMVAYANQLIHNLQQPSYPLSFVDVYLPLVLGGVLIEGQTVFRDERPLDILHSLIETFDRRRREPGGHDDFVVNLISQGIDTALQKYGYRM
ncbi:MAG: hypothetical protein OHK0046_10940 [Anaerolineae bacterium]